MNDIFLIQGSTLTDTADTIRKHIGGGGISPEDFPEKIDEVYDEGYDEGKKDAEPNLQNKTITSNGKHTADSGYDGLGTVTVNVNDAPELQTGIWVTPARTQQTITPNSGYDGFKEVIVEGDSDLQSGNIKAGVTIFGVAGNYAGESCDHTFKTKTVDPDTITKTYNANSDGVSGYSAVTVNAIKSIERAPTYISSSVSENGNSLVITAENRQAEGYVFADEGKDVVAEPLTIELSANGKTVTARATPDGGEISKSVDPAERAETVITASVDQQTNQVTVRAVNNQGTGWVVADPNKNSDQVLVTLYDGKDDYGNYNGSVTAKITNENNDVEISRYVPTADLAEPKVLVLEDGTFTATVTQETSGWVEKGKKVTEGKLPNVKFNTDYFNLLTFKKGVVSLYKGLSGDDSSGWLAYDKGFEVQGTLDLTQYISPNRIVYGEEILGVQGTGGFKTTVENISRYANVLISYKNEDGQDDSDGLVPGLSGTYSNVTNIRVENDTDPIQLHIEVDSEGGHGTINAPGYILDYMFDNDEVFSVSKQGNYQLQISVNDPDFTNESANLAVRYEYGNKSFVAFYQIHST